MDRYEISDWSLSEPNTITATLTDTIKKKQTVMVMSHKDVIKSTPVQLLSLVSKLIQNAMNS